ncbi:hypothetical protein MBR_04778, partial [Metarhizium brunneum ARSEF 3297]
MLSLEPEEVGFHLGQGINFSRVDVAKLLRLRSFANIRTQFSTSGVATLIAYVKYLERLSNGLKTDTIDKLVAEKKQLTLIDASDNSAFFTTCWPMAIVKDLAKTFFDGDLYSLQQLTEACSLSKDLGVPITTLQELKTALSSSSASTSGGALARAKEVVIPRQQHVLQEYIIRLPVFVNRGIITTGDLSADFLMDLQMGPPMETSRIGQAIASAQFFIQ